MNILYITQFFHPERVASAFRALDNARIWKSQGHDVTIFTAYPNFPTGRLFNGYKIHLLWRELIHGINVFRSKIIIKPNTNILLRVICYCSFLFFGIVNMIISRKQIDKDYDIVLATSGTIFAAVLGLLYAKKYNIPFVLELRDITYKQMLATGTSKRQLRYRVLKHLELFLCRNAAKVITVTNGFKQDLVDEGISQSKIEVIPNGVILREQNPEMLQKNNDEFIISYFGSFGYSQNLLEIIKYFNSIRVPGKKKKLILIGDGADKDKLLKYRNDNGLLNIDILDSVPQEYLEEFYQMSDLCLVVLRNNSYFKNTIPSKVFQIMGRKKAVLFIGPEGEAASIVREAEAGILLTDKDMSKNILFFNKYINELITTGNFASQMEKFGRSGFQYTKLYYDRELLSNKYIQILKRISKTDSFNVDYQIEKVTGA